MKYPVRFFVIILITICTSILKAEEALEKLPKIVYINMNKVMNETSAGKSLINQLEKLNGNINKISDDRYNLYSYNINNLFDKSTPNVKIEFSTVDNYIEFGKRTSRSIR